MLCIRQNFTQPLQCTLFGNGTIFIVQQTGKRHIVENNCSAENLLLNSAFVILHRYICNLFILYGCNFVLVNRYNLEYLVFKCIIVLK